jgi:transcription elongation factor GreB
MSPYITPEGERALKDELYQLWKVERPKVTQSVSEAAAQGDRSENAEYTYGKKRLREIDRRVRYLRKRLDVMIVVRQLPADRNKAFFGAWVKLVDENNATFKYRLVGPDEIDPSKQYVSIDSVMGRALLGKAVDSEIKITTPSGVRSYVITEVEYAPIQAEDD